MNTVPIDKYKKLRMQMVQKQIYARGIHDTHILSAMEQVERHVFVPKDYLHLAYTDSPLPIGYQQTISQPYMVALMTKLCTLTFNSTYSPKILEIGTGCGYQTAILSVLGCKVYTIELLPELVYKAQKTIEYLGYKNIFPRLTNGYKGWVEEAPFDAILVTAASKKIPQQLLEQVKENGTIVIPIGSTKQALWSIKKVANRFEKKKICSVRFVELKE